MYAAINWLDGTKLVHFSIHSELWMETSSRAQALKKALSLIELQGRLAGAQAKVGDFGQWCIEASEWVNLMVDLARMDQRLASREGLRTRQEESRAVDSTSSALASLVRRETFELVRARRIGLEPRCSPSPSTVSTTPTHNASLGPPRLKPPHARAPLASETPPAHAVTRARPSRLDAPSTRTAHPTTASYGDATRPTAPRPPDTREEKGREGTDERGGEGLEERGGSRHRGTHPPPQHRADARARTPAAALAAPVDGAREPAANGCDAAPPRLYVPPHACAPASAPSRPPHRANTASPAPPAAPTSPRAAAAATANAGAANARDAPPRRATASPRALAAAPAPPMPVVPAAAIDVAPAASADPPASTQGCCPAHTRQAVTAAAPTPRNVERRHRRRRLRSPMRVRTRPRDGTQRPPHVPARVSPACARQPAHGVSLV